jgi:hypothetical protein
MNINPKIVLAKISETTGSASFSMYIRDSRGDHKVASPHCTPHIIGPIPFATVREHDSSENNPANYLD